MARKRTSAARTVTRRQTPDAELVAWDGKNADVVLDLVERVAGLHIWSPLEHGPFTMQERDADGRSDDDDDEIHPGLSIVNTLGQIVVRIEHGNSIVFDPFAETPLFAMIPDHVKVFYGGSD
jgi:hypothetical protein